MLKEKVLQTIKENNLIKKSDKIILGISGGPDSVCLFNILHSLKKELKLKLILAHVNYRFRGEDSDLDERFVKSLASKFKIRLYIKRINPKEYAPKNLEEHFRDIRYNFFEEILNKEKADKIAAAHNKDDQIETILMFFLRGSGLSGISGMKIKNKKIIRPLFEITKKEILAYLKENKIKYREDKTNKNTKFTRNRIRRKLIPYLEKEFNPNLKNTLFENAKIIRDDHDYLSKMAGNVFNDLTKKDKAGFSLDLKRFNKTHIALKKRLLILILEKFNKKISLLLLSDILKIIKDSKTGSKKCLGELEILKNYDRIVFRRKKIRKKIRPVSLEIEGQTKIRELNLEIKTTKVDKAGKISKNRCYIDLEKSGVKLFVRSRKEGDRLYLKGISGSQKLKDFFINNKISKDERDQVPLVINSEDKIVWVVGYRMDRRFEADKNSKDVLEIKML